MKTRTNIEKINVTDLTKWLDDAMAYLDKMDSALELRYNNSCYTAICDPQPTDTLGHKCAKIIDRGGGIELCDLMATEPETDKGMYDRTRGIVVYPFRAWHVKHGFEAVLNRDSEVDNTRVVLLERLVRFYDGEISESEIGDDRERLAFELLQVVATGGVILC